MSKDCNSYYLLFFSLLFISKKLRNLNLYVVSRLVDNTKQKIQDTPKKCI